MKPAESSPPNSALNTPFDGGTAAGPRHFLGAVPEHVGAENPAPQKRYFAHVATEQVARNPLNPRKAFASAPLFELADSIRAQGILQPVAVRRVDVIDPDDAQRPCRYELILGERRWRAARLAKLEEMPAMVFEGVSREQALEMALVENLQREDMNAIEEAEGLAGLRALGLTQEQIAQRVGMSRSRVANALRLIDLPEPVKEHVRAGRLTQAHAEALLRFRAWPKVLGGIAELAIEHEAPSKDLESGVPFDWELQRKKLVARIDDYSLEKHHVGLKASAAEGQPWCFTEKEKWGGVARHAMDLDAFEAWIAARKAELATKRETALASAQAAADKAKAAGKPVPKKAQQVLAAQAEAAPGGMSAADKRERARKIAKNRAARARLEAAWEQAMESIAAIDTVREADVRLVCGWAEDSLNYRFRDSAVQREVAVWVGVPITKERPFAKLPAVDLIKVTLAQALYAAYTDAKRGAGAVPEDMEAYAKGFERRMEPAAGAEPEAEAPKGRTRSVISPEMREHVLEAFRAGKTACEVAKTFGLSLPAVANIKKAAGLVKAR